MIRRTSRPRRGDAAALRTDGGEADREATDTEVLATITSAEIRTYDLTEALPETVAASDPIASLSDYNLDIAVDIVTKTATVHTPARISVTVEYVGEESLPYTGNGRALRKYVPNFTSTTGLHLYPADSTIRREDERCWRAPILGHDLSLVCTSFEPNEPYEAEYDILADPENGRCYPQGEHEIIQRYNLSDEPAVYWGIGLELTRH